MANYFYDTPLWLKGFQDNLNHNVPPAPRDAVWGCVKSAGFSHIATMLLTKGNIVSGTLTPPVGAVATVIHTIIMTGLKPLKDHGYINISEEQWRYVPPLATLSGTIGSYYLGKKMGIKSHFWASLIATAFSYALTQNHLKKCDLTTPLFITIIV
jgi:hypothetical protein